MKKERKTTELNLPNIQTSLAVVNRLKLMDSGAIHLIGSLPLDAKKQKSEELRSLSSCRFCEIRCLAPSVMTNQKKD